MRRIAMAMGPVLALLVATVPALPWTRHRCDTHGLPLGRPGHRVQLARSEVRLGELELVPGPTPAYRVQVSRKTRTFSVIT